MTEPQLRSLLAELPAKSIAVIGDFCVDYYLFLDQSRSEISVETGLATRAVRSVRMSPGGAGNVIANLRALGVGRIAAFGVVGNDAFAPVLSTMITELGADASGLVRQGERWHTHVYTKLYEGQREHERVDYGNFNEPTARTVDELLARLESRLDACDLVIVNEQVMFGVNTAEVRSRIAALIARHPEVPFIVDSRRFSDDYAGAVRKLNTHEGARLCGLTRAPGERITRDEALQILERLHERWRRPLFITRGEHGCLVRDEEGLHEIPGLLVSGPTDPVGAGDAMLAGVACALACGARAPQAAELGNFAAAVTVRKLFETGTASPDEVLALAKEPAYRHRPELAATAARARYHANSDVEIVTDARTAARARFAIFDNDGTLSTLRQGWEAIMEPMMIAAILGDGNASGREASDEECARISRAVREFIDATTGVQTILQMAGLADLVRRFGRVPETDVLSAEDYKARYNEQLLAMVGRRLARLHAGELEQSDFLVKGALELVRALKERGLRLYLASGTDQADVEREAAELGYAELFDGRVYGSVGDPGNDPKSVVLRRILAEIGPEAGSAIVTFGDGPVEVRATKSAGGTSVGVASDEVRRWGLDARKRTRLIEAGADFVVPDFTHRRALLELLGLGSLR